jgi:hypothetical protein
MYFNIIRRRDTKICIVTTYTTDWRTEDRGSIIGRSRSFYFLQKVQSDSRKHPVSDLEDTGDNFPDLQRPENEADLLPPTRAEVANERSDTSNFPRVFMSSSL